MQWNQPLSNLPKTEHPYLSKAAARTSSDAADATKIFDFAATISPDNTEFPISLRSINPEQRFKHLDEFG